MQSPHPPRNQPQPEHQNSHSAQASTNYKEAFALFDKRGTGRVALESLGDLLRACGQNPTLAEIAELEKNVGGDCKLANSSVFAFSIEGGESQWRLELKQSLTWAKKSWLTEIPDGIVDFDSFSKVLNRPGGFRDPGEPEEYCRGFQVFDKDMTGFIGVGQLRYILTNLGEKMSDDEVDELLKAVDTTSGEINYTGNFFMLDYSI